MYQGVEMTIGAESWPLPREGQNAEDKAERFMAATCHHLEDVISLLRKRNMSTLCWPLEMHSVLYLYCHLRTRTAPQLCSSATDTRRGFGTPFRRQSTRHNARATEDEGAALEVIARSTDVSLDDIRVSVRSAFIVSSGCLSYSVVRVSDKCDFALLMDAIVTCIESSPLLCPSVEGECTLCSNERDGVFTLREGSTVPAAGCFAQFGSP